MTIKQSEFKNYNLIELKDMSIKPSNLTIDGLQIQQSNVTFEQTNTTQQTLKLNEWFSFICLQNTFETSLQNSNVSNSLFMPSILYIDQSTKVTLDRLECNNNRINSTQTAPDTIYQYTLKNIQKIQISNSKFENNRLQQGGCIQIGQSGLIQMHNSVFIQNQVYDQKLIQITLAQQIIVYGSLFEKNQGLVLFLFKAGQKNSSYIQTGMYEKYTCELKVERTKFIENTVYQYGGVIFAYQLGQIRIRDSEFRSNQMLKQLGGCIHFLTGNLLKLSNVTFDNDYSQIAGSNLIINDVEQSQIDNCSFNGNISKQSLYAGSIYIHNNWRLLNVTIMNSVFRNYRAFKQGGAIIVLDCNMYLINNTFENVHAGDIGGAIDSQISYMVIRNNVFRNVSSMITGGALSLTNGYIEIYNSSFTNCESFQGGSISIFGGDKVNKSLSHLYATQQMLIQDSQLIGGKAGSASMMHIMQAHESITFVIKNCSFIGNHVKLGIGIFNVRFNVSIIDSAFINNTAVYPPSVLMSLESHINITNTRFEYNEAESQILSYTSRLKLDNCSFRNTLAEIRYHYEISTAQIIISYSGSFLELYNTHFINNSKKKYLIAQYLSNGILENNTFIGNHLYSSLIFTGYNYYHYGYTVTINNNSFENNTVYGDNGILEFVNSSNIMVKGNRFNNNVGKYGTCISVNGEFWSSNIKQNYFTNNKATYGASIYLNNVQQISIEQNRFENNKAQTVINSIFYQNFIKSYVNIRNNVYTQGNSNSNQIEVFSYPKKFHFNISYQFPNETVRYLEMDKVNNSYYQIHNFVNVKNRVYQLTIHLLDKDDKVVNVSYAYDRRDSWDMVYQIMEDGEMKAKLRIPDNQWYINQTLDALVVPQFQVPIDYKPNRQLFYITFYSDIVNVQDLDQSVNRQNYQKLQGYSQNQDIFQISIEFVITGCQRGEYRQDDGKCIECQQKQFSYDISQFCTPCQSIEGHEECLGRDQTLIKQGYWRETAYTNDIIKCDKNMKQICSNSREQRMQGGNHLCQDGYSGAKCKSCDFYGKHSKNNETHYKQGNNCMKCSNLKSEGQMKNGLIITISLLIKMFMVSFIIYKQVNGQYLIIVQKILANSFHKVIRSKSEKIHYASSQCSSNSERFKLATQIIQQNKKYCQKYGHKTFRIDEKSKEKGINVFKCDLSENVQFVTIYKILSIQILVIQFLNKFEIEYQYSFFLSSLFNIDSIIDDAYFSVQCLFGQGLQSMSVVSKYNLIVFFEQFMTYFMYSLMILVTMVRSNSSFRSRVWVYIKSGLIICLYNNYSKIIQNSLRVLMCVRIGEQMYIQSDLNIKCVQADFEVEYLITAIVAFIWIFILPLGLFYIIYRRKQQLNNSYNLTLFGFIYVEYKKENYYQEIIRISLKILIVFFELYEFINITVRGICIVAIMSVYLIWIIKLKPYLQVSCNYLDFMNSLICQGIILVFCMMTYIQAKNNNNQLNQTVEYKFQKLFIQIFIGLLTIVVIVLTFKFYKVIVRLLFRDLYAKMEMKVQQYLSRQKNSRNVLMQYITRKFQVVDLKTKKRWQRLFIRLMETKKQNINLYRSMSMQQSIGYREFKMQVEQDRSLIDHSNSDSLWNYFNKYFVNRYLQQNGVQVQQVDMVSNQCQSVHSSQQSCEIRSNRKVNYEHLQSEVDQSRGPRLHLDQRQYNQKVSLDDSGYQQVELQSIDVDDHSQNQPQDRLQSQLYFQTQSNYMLEDHIQTK